ncbi:MAG: NAD(P)-dependent oxidoreductase [Candidatus Omnitrophica bacterium]|nr:NAD(P)-dependent oxidoreductase [Candidatus Omnitrophota bacterium]
MTKKTIIITGASGFVGAALIKQAAKDGNRVIALKRESSDLTRIKNVKGVYLFNYETLLEKKNLQKIKSLKPDIFIHAAWQGVGGKDRNELFQITNNLPFTLDLVQLAYDVGCAHWIGIGSQAEYGNPNQKVDELFPTNPTTLYGKSKVATSWSALGLCQASGMTGSWVRLFSPYGPDDNPDWFIPYVIKELSQGRAPKLTKCEQLWDYLYIDDVATGILSVAYANAPGIFNLGSGKAVPLRKIIEIIQKLVNPKIQPQFGAIEYRPDQVMHLEADIRKIKKITGWTPQTNLKQGLEKTVQWFQHPNN